MSRNIGAVIVAAGLSSRMGGYKPLMEIGGQTVARRVVSAFAASEVSPIVVVTGHRADELEAHLREYAEGLSHNSHIEAAARSALTGGHGERGGGHGEQHRAQPIQFARNEAYATTPMFESARIGLAHIMDQCARTFFCPIDIPLFTAATVRTLMGSGAPIAKPTHNGEEGHPIVLSTELIPAILERGGESGLKTALASFNGETERIEVPDKGILYDADTPADFQKLLELEPSCSLTR
ncbi:MAG: nucleotidyltransferase family protein [Clostridiales Family XIII bacterium]|jgi:CTP:molybdopterin cytidylyltransferase MocA|nr:nucleotidyltransferase family protein [Clostridiales Family XIII bacterium]